MLNISHIAHVPTQNKNQNIIQLHFWWLLHFVIHRCACSPFPRHSAFTVHFKSTKKKKTNMNATMVACGSDAGLIIRFAFETNSNCQGVGASPSEMERLLV